MRRFGQFILDSGRWGVASDIAALVSLGFAIVEHFRDRQVAAFWFMGATVILFCCGTYTAWFKKDKAVEKLENERELPKLYLFFDPNFSGQGIFNHTGLFLRTEDERIASSIRLSSPETVGQNHSRLRIRWTNPGQNVGQTAFPVQFRCVKVKGDQESTFNSIDGEQFLHYFNHKKDDSLDLVVTVEYTDIHGNPCPRRRFRIYKDPKTLILMPDRFICEPLKD